MSEHWGSGWQRFVERERIVGEKKQAVKDAERKVLDAVKAWVACQDVRSRGNGQLFRATEALLQAENALAEAQGKSE